MCFSFTPCYFAIIHIKYHIKMSPLASHAFLGMLSIFVSTPAHLWLQYRRRWLKTHKKNLTNNTFLSRHSCSFGYAELVQAQLIRRGLTASLLRNIMYPCVFHYIYPSILYFFIILASIILFTRIYISSDTLSLPCRTRSIFRLFHYHIEF